jgi:hypothetical protein
MDRCVGRAADRGVDDDCILERFFGQDVGRPQVLPHHFDDALAGFIGDLAAFAIWRGDCRAAGSDMPSASASEFMVEAVPMVLQWPTDGAEDATISMNSS